MLPLPAGAAESEGITWLIEFDGKHLPDPAVWARRGQSKTELVASALHIADESDQDDGCFRAPFKVDASQEIVVEARVKIGGITGVRGNPKVWPWRDGVPAGILIRNGTHQDGLVFLPTRILTFTDRVFMMNTTNESHAHQLAIHGNDMCITGDGKEVIRGRSILWANRRRLRQVLRHLDLTRRFGPGRDAGRQNPPTGLRRNQGTHPTFQASHARRDRLAHRRAHRLAPRLGR
jgi:hypothetical protein